MSNGKKRRGSGDGAIYQRKDGRWAGSMELGWPDGSRKRKYVYGRTRAEVRTKLREVQRMVENGLNVGDEKMTVGRFAPLWLENIIEGSMSTTTVENYKWAIESHIIPALGRKRLRTLRTTDVADLLKAMVKDGYKRNTVMRVRSVLAAIVNQACAEGYTERNVVKLVPLPKAPEAKGRSLTLVEAKTLLDVAESHPLGAAVVLMTMTGLRPGEALGLRWEDVDLEAGVLHVRQALKQRTKGRSLQLGSLKTPRSRRSIALPAQVSAALRTHRARQAEQRLRAGESWDDLGLVFTIASGKPIDPRNFRRTFTRITKSAGLGHWTPKELRHTAVSLLSHAGVPIEQVGDVVGHDGVRMTATTYRHAVVPTVKTGAVAMDRLLPAASKGS